MVALRVRRVRPEDEFVVAYDQYVGLVLISFLGPSGPCVVTNTVTPDDGQTEENDDDLYYCIGERLKLEGETENMGVWANDDNV